MLLPVILIRLLTQEEYGVYQQALLLSLTATSLLTFNFPHSLFYFYPIATEREKQSELLSQTYYLMMIVAFAFFFAALLLRNPIGQLINFDPQLYLAVILHITLTIIYGPIGNLFIIEEKAKLAMYYHVISQIIRVALILSAMFWQPTSSAAIWALVLFAALNTIFIHIYLIKLYRISPLKVRGGHLMKQFKYALPMGLSGIVGTIGNKADKLILAALFTASDYAIYAVGNLQIPFIALIYTSVGNVILPRISQYSTDEANKVKSLHLWGKMIEKNAIITIPVVVFALVAAKPVFTVIFGVNYVASANVFRIIVLIFFVQMLGFGYVLRGYGDTKPIFIANLVKMFVSIGLGYPLIKAFGFIGAALAYTLSFSSNAIIQIIRTRQLLQVTWKRLLPWRSFGQILLISVASASLFWPLLLAIDLPDALLAAVFGCLYFLFVLFFLLKYKYWTLSSLAKFKQTFAVV